MIIYNQPPDPFITLLPFLLPALGFGFEGARELQSSLRVFLLNFTKKGFRARNDTEKSVEYRQPWISAICRQNNFNMSTCPNTFYLIKSGD